jgi:hypothetical protein
LSNSNRNVRYRRKADIRLTQTNDCFGGVKRTSAKAAIVPPFSFGADPTNSIPKAPGSTGAMAKFCLRNSRFASPTGTNSLARAGGSKDDQLHGLGGHAIVGT